MSGAGLWEVQQPLTEDEFHSKYSHKTRRSLAVFANFKFISFRLRLAVIAAHYPCCDEARGEDVPGGAG